MHSFYPFLLLPFLAPAFSLPTYDSNLPSNQQPFLPSPPRHSPLPFPSTSTPATASTPETPAPAAATETIVLTLAFSTLSPTGPVASYTKLLLNKFTPASQLPPLITDVTLIEAVHLHEGAPYDLENGVVCQAYDVDDAPLGLAFGVESGEVDLMGDEDRVQGAESRVGGLWCQSGRI